MSVSPHVPGLGDVREQIYGHVFDSPDSEVGGILVGMRDFDHGMPWVGAIIPAFGAEGSMTTLTFTHEAWARIYAQMEEEHPDRDIVGWYHSHPGHGIFLSDHDLFIHQNFFPDQSAIALVVDPVREEEGVFGWRRGSIEKLAEAPTTRRSGETSTAPKQAPEQASRRPQESPPPPFGSPMSETSALFVSSPRDYPLLAYAIPGITGLLLGILLAVLVTDAGASAQPERAPALHQTSR